MAVNIRTGFNVAVAKKTIAFTDAGINASNIYIIFQVKPDRLFSYDPSRAINAINSFEQYEGYYIIANQDIDLTAIVSTTLSEGGNTGSGAVLLEDGNPVLIES